MYGILDLISRKQKIYEATCRDDDFLCTSRLPSPTGLGKTTAHAENRVVL